MSALPATAEAASPAASGHAPAAGWEEHPPLPGEDQLWAAAPLINGVRDLRVWPESAREALAEHYLPFVLQRLNLFGSSIRHHFPDRAEVKAQAGLWLLLDMTKYDPARGVPFASFIAVTLRTHVHSLARAGGSGRYLADSELAHARVSERYLREHHRTPTLHELAAELGEDMNAASERARAVAMRRGLRHHLDLADLDPTALSLSSDGAVWAQRPVRNDEPLADLLAAERGRALTQALVFAAWNAGSDDAGAVNVAGLWALLLETYEGYCRSDLARAAKCNPRSIVAAENTLISAVRQRLGDDFTMPGAT